MNSKYIFYIWIIFVIFDLIIFFFIDKELSILFALVMIPMFIHDILLGIFKKK